jgi:glycosyltransferase involved in cell wall biosynthesis
LIDNRIASEENVKLIRCGIVVPPSPPEKPAGTIKIIAASRFTREKGLDIFIRAVSKLETGVKQNTEFIVAGMGEEEQALKQLNSDLNAGVSFPGNFKNLNDILKDTHIFVYTSRSGSEGFPAVITEAGAFNNLLITSDFRGIQSIVKDGVDGFVFPSDNYEKLAVLLKGAIANYPGLKEMSLNFYTKVRSLFDLQTMITKHDELYKECLRA